MSIHLHDDAVKTFKKLIDAHQDDLLTPDEVVHGINTLLVKPIVEIHPGRGIEYEMLRPENLLAFINGYGIIDESDFKVLLEEYLDYLADKTDNPPYNKKTFQDKFNAVYGRHNRVDVNEDDVNMDIDPPPSPQQHEDDDDRAEEERAIALSLMPMVVPRTKTLKELNEAIQVFNPLLPGYELASVFMEEQDDYQPFIVRSANGNFSGDTIKWPATSSGGKEFIECKDSTPSNWQGNNYGRWVKPNARNFIKINISGSVTLVIKPSWYDRGVVPGTKYFHLVPMGTVHKFVSKVLASQNLPPDFSVLGAEHCNQTGPVGIYMLQEITLEELNKMVPSGGKRTRTTHKTRTNKKTKNRKLKSKSSKSKYRKH